MKKLVMGVLLINLLAACATQKPAAPVSEAKPASGAAVQPASATATATAPTMPSAPASVAVDPLNDPSSLLAKRSVYYPHDVDAVQDADKPAVRAHANYLAAHPNRTVRLEGHADERGSSEYNLALGQRRAEGVKKMLALGGAKDGQIETVSYGEEKPKASGHDEMSWAQNRRTDIKYNAR